MSKMGCFLLVLGILAFSVAIAAFEAWLLMLLWNWAVVLLFGAPTISFWLAWAILILLNLIGSAFRTSVTVNK